MDRGDTGLLLNPNAKLYRGWFKEMTKLIGINVIYRACKPNMHYDGYGELDSYYEEGKLEGCIFEEHPSQVTVKKLGWVNEVDTNSSIIHVRYDLENLQVGSLFIVPSGIDNSVGRVYRVIRMSTIMLYPASIACELAPEYQSNFDRSQLDHHDNNFNLLSEEED